MIRVYLLVEGQTEAAFVRELLVPHYAVQGRGLDMRPIVIRTSDGHRGGVVSYGKVRNQVVRLCAQDSRAHVSTMLDLYGLPNDFPGRQDRAYPHQGTGVQKADFLEIRFGQDVAQPRFFPNIMVHEFEALLFAGPEHFAREGRSRVVVERIAQVLAGGIRPEDVNDGPQTAPSKRIMAAVPGYKKVVDGPLIAKAIGLDVLRAACPHFDAWLRKMDQLARH